MKNFIMLFLLGWVLIPGNVSAQFLTYHNIQYNNRGNVAPHVHFYKDNIHADHYNSNITRSEQKHLFKLYREYDITREKALRDGRINYKEARKLQMLERKIQRVTRGNKKCRR